MLGKLIRYEWKNTYKICGSLLAFLAAVTLLVGLSLQTPFWGNLFADGGRKAAEVGGWGSATALLSITGVFFYFLTLVGVYVGMFLYLGVHFYKTMYDDEGYLTHTLPVTSKQLLNSRLLVGSLWSVAGALMLLLSILGMIFAIVTVMIHTVRSFEEWNSMAITYGDAFGVLWELVKEVIGSASVGEILIWLAGTLVGVVSKMMILFGAVTLGQLSAKLRVVMSIVWYFVIQISLTLIHNWLLMPLLYNMMPGASSSVSLLGVLTPTNLANLLTRLVMTVGLYFLSNYIITSKLNLE